MSALAWLFTLWTPFYATITAVCVIFLYLSYVLPTALGARAYRRTWTRMGPFDLGPWFRPLAVVGVLECLALVVVGMQPPNGLSAWVVGGTLLALLVAWFAVERNRFAGPPRSGWALTEPSGGDDVGSMQRPLGSTDRITSDQDLPVGAIAPLPRPHGPP